MKIGAKLAWAAGVVTSMACLGAAVSYAVTKKMLGIALERHISPTAMKAKSRLIHTEYLEEALRLQKELAQRLENRGCKTITMTACDGTELAGHLHCCPNARRTIIAMHGWRSSWAKDFGMIADFLFENQCNVLFAEQRGQGRSGGSHMTFGLMERYDCLYWISWVGQQNFAELPIYLAGISMGAATVLMTTGFPLPDTVKGVIADCGYTSAHEIWKYVSRDNLHLPYGQLRYLLVTALCKRQIHLDPESYSCTEALRQAQVPVLFIHGSDDQFVPVEMTYENYKACASPKRLLIVPGADHGMSYLMEKDRYEAEVKRFWADYDH